MKLLLLLFAASSRLNRFSFNHHVSVRIHQRLRPEPEPEPEPSCVSFKSDRSKGLIIEFKSPGSPLSWRSTYTQDSSRKRVPQNMKLDSDSPNPKAVALRSDSGDFASFKRGAECPLPNPAGAILTKGPVEDTEYKDNPEEVDGWGKFYLPETVKMKVIGYVQGTPYCCDQLVLMTCEDQKVYGYDGDELHLVAKSMQQLLKKGIAYPAFESYYYGEAFKHMTEEAWEKVKQGPVGKRLDEEHRKLVASCK
uniref:Uncharacterized protein n=1 Tax=Poecilia formosa TaxID=48698 RepID=A0A087XBU4_POEFO